MGSFNVYENAKRAEAYAKLEFPGTYYLAYRDLPDIIFVQVKGRKAIDFRMKIIKRSSSAPDWNQSKRINRWRRSTNCIHGSMRRG